ncbi:phosphohydrolase [Arcobacter sp. CECT 8983]|uniref:HD domain-containing phosphohydrolase n=1 Tax=Arcobacter sp. CECT 8983 TaxID=2044508 RepID=UPI00100A38E5|nr:HD domain-containing phosphohydrolase [Arcobacter sp. CECT 8983]RXJ88990.1 phosphohydrolase [Arcobacter sp. CECT 8983]
MNYLKVLGASGSKTKLKGTTSFQIFKNIIIDAGNVINTLSDETLFIDHIFITHSHSDHIIDLPFIIESFYERRKETLKIYGSKETINSLKEHTFNDKIWPDFTKINLLKSDKKALEFIEIKEEQSIKIENYEITAIKANHIKGAYGYQVIKDDDLGYLISGDTYINPKIWEILNNNYKIKCLIIECSFPSHLKQLAHASMHLTPELLKKELENIQRDDIQIFLYHLKPSFYEEIVEEIKEYKILENGGKILNEGDIIHIDTKQIESDLISQNKFERIMDINLQLSSELDKSALFEMILTLTRELTHCEAGTLYIMSKDKKSLEFKVVQNDPLNIFMGGTKDDLTWDSLPLYLKDGSKNKSMVAVVAAMENRIINIPDVYNNEDYNFQGTKDFDKRTGYESKSMLVIPLINHEEDVIGVLQLINKTKISKSKIAFTEEDEKIIKALASQAAMALTNSFLINSLEEFLNAFVTTIAHAVDAKSKHTRNHIGRVAKVANYLARAIHEDETTYKEVRYSENDFRQIELAAWMHDIGKISMPESIIDKSTKLEKMIDRIGFIEERVEILKRDEEIKLLKNEITQEEYIKNIEKYDNDIKFLKRANIGGEFMEDKDIERVKEIAKYNYIKKGEKTSFLSEDEEFNLCIKKGTLTSNEKSIMNYHAQLSLDMLSSLPFPKKYKDVLNIAVNHHEKLNGNGYPRGLDETQLSLEDRIMILADIFEALTSNDRPYKDAKKLSEVFKILSFMAKDGEIDKNLLKFFHENEALKQYAYEELFDYQIDESKLLF